jgi:hypothetical protein
LDADDVFVVFGEGGATMAEEVISKNDSITVWYDPAVGMVRHQMHKFTRGDEFRGALEAGAGALEKHGGNKWLSDDRAHIVLPAEDEEWAKTIWFPRVKAAGWKYWAIVKPEKAIAQLNMKRFIEMYEPLGITARMFSDLEEARSWLHSQA